MQDLASAFTAAFGLILSLDPAVLAVVALSLRVSLSALLLAALIGLPLGALLAVARFPGRGGVISTAWAMIMAVGVNSSPKEPSGPDRDSNR